MGARQAVLRLVFGAVLAAGFPSFAACAADDGGGDRIRIIQDDGSVVDFQIPPLNHVPEAPAPSAAPPSAPAEKPEKPVRREAVKKEEAAKRKPAEKRAPVAVVRTKAGVPLPPRKPSRAPAAAETQAPRRAERPVFTPGMEVTRDVARRLALREAPPARRIDISRGVYRDRPVYDVVFMTEDGRYSVLVDAQTGDILGKGYE